MSTTLSSHPLGERLRGERALLRQEFARAVMAARDLEVVVRPYVLALFQLALGAAELARLIADHRYRRARRALELLRAELNRGAVPDHAAVEAKLDGELRGYWAMVDDKAAQLERARRVLATEVKPVDAAELRRLYLQLVLALHPDLHPRQAAEDVERWHRLQRAYADGDLELLRALAAHLVIVADDEDSLGALEREVEELRRRLRELEESTARLEATPPFNLRAQLEDATWVAARREALAAETAELERRADVLEQQWRELVEGVGRGEGLAGSHGGTGAGSN